MNNINKCLILLACVSLSACGDDDNHVSKSDLEKALAQSPQAGSVCVPFTLDTTAVGQNDEVRLGAAEIRLLKNAPNGKRANVKAMEQMDILVDADIYDDEGVTKEQGSEHDKVVRYATYRLTETGRQAFRATPHGAFLCIGTWEVKKIHYYTEPAPSNGVTLSRVSFDAKIKTERWARKLLKNSPYYEGLSQTETRTATLMKTNQGWRDIHALSGTQ